MYRINYQEFLLIYQLNYMINLDTNPSKFKSLVIIVLDGQWSSNSKDLCKFLKNIGD